MRELVMWAVTSACLNIVCSAAVMSLGVLAVWKKPDDAQCVFGIGIVVSWLLPDQAPRHMGLRPAPQAQVRAL